MQTKTSAKIEAVFTLTLSESEAEALHAITLYGADSFLKFFYSNLGKTYLYPHEDGLRKLFNSIGGLNYGLEQATKARQVFYGQSNAVKKL